MTAYFDFLKWWWEKYFEYSKLLVRQIEMEEVRSLRNCWLETHKMVKDFDERLINNGIT